MLAIPELRLVLIQPPRTGSTALRAALEAAYPETRRLYRHMERDGIPGAYDGWSVACTIRHPLARLHSLWRYMRAQKPDDHSDKDWVRRVTTDAGRPFRDWVLYSQDPFTTPPQGTVANPAFYDIRHSAPITRKSQYVWARPDLGPVTLIRLEVPEDIRATLGVIPDPNLSNAAPGPGMSAPCARIEAHLTRYFSWDLSSYQEDCYAPCRISSDRRKCGANPVHAGQPVAMPVADLP